MRRGRAPLVSKTCIPCKGEHHSSLFFDIKSPSDNYLWSLELSSPLAPPSELLFLLCRVLLPHQPPSGREGNRDSGGRSLRLLNLSLKVNPYGRAPFVLICIKMKTLLKANYKTNVGEREQIYSVIIIQIAYLKRLFLRRNAPKSRFFCEI